MSRVVHVVAIGARTPVGLLAESAAAAVRARISRVRAHPFMVDSTGEKLRCAYDARLDPSLFGASRLLALAHAALGEVTSKLTRHGPYPLPIAGLVALPESRPGLPVHHVEWVAHSLGAQPLAKIHSLQVHAVGVGHAGALYALETGALMISQGKAELCIAGGVDSYLEADTIAWLDSERRLACDDTRSGFPPGEGAGFLALASQSTRMRLGLPSLARIRGIGTARETRSLDSDEGTLGEGLTQAVLAAGADLHPGREVVTDLYCDINGERWRIDDWRFALLRTQRLFQDGSIYTNAVGEWGDLGAASGALNCILAIQAWQRRYARGPRAMVWGSSWSGLRAAAVLEQGAD